MGGTPYVIPQGQPTKLKDGEFQSGSVPNAVTFAFSNVQPPAPLYIQRDDTLVLGAGTSLASETVTFNIRFLPAPFPLGGQPGKPSGSSDASAPAAYTRAVIVPETEIFTLGAADQFLFRLRNRNLAEGYMVSITAIASAATQRGQTFARAFLIRGAVAAASGNRNLFADYCTLSHVVGWPDGRVVYPTEGPGLLQAVTIANPAAGTDWTMTVPTNMRRRVAAFQAQLVTSAAVGSRNVQAITDDGATAYWTHDPPSSQLAGATVQYVGTTGQAPVGVIATVQPLVLPGVCILPAGHRLRVSTAAIQAGDQWSNIRLLVEDWLDTV